jgi:Skp family chaperone for outer membrane proteins
MKTILSSAAIAAAALAIPATASAQRLPAAVVAVVDNDRIGSECTACRAAAAQLRSQENALRTRAQTLQRELETTGKPIQDAINALGSRQPDAALQQRMTAYRQREQQARQEIANAETNLRSINAHVNQQIAARLRPIIASVAASRGATVAIPKDVAIYAAPTVEITNDVLAQLNSQLPAVSITPLPQQQQTQTQGR